jgi:hypothetical protein
MDQIFNFRLSWLLLGLEVGQVAVRTVPSMLPLLLETQILGDLFGVDRGQRQPVAGHDGGQEDSAFLLLFSLHSGGKGNHLQNIPDFLKSQL